MQQHTRNRSFHVPKVEGQVRKFLREAWEYPGPCSFLLLGARDLAIVCFHGLLIECGRDVMG